MTVDNSRARSTLFRLYHRTNYWGDPTTRSGDSSRPERAKVATKLLQSILNANPRIRLLDLGCGDFSWGSKLCLPSTCRYIGVDIVPEVIEANSHLYSSPPRLQFMTADATVDELPEADVVLIRDLFIHLEDDEIRAVLRAVDRCQPSLLIASSYRGSSGPRSLEKWNSAPMDLENKGYGLGSADFFIPEAPDFDRPEDGVKGLAGWRRSTKVQVDLVSLTFDRGSGVTTDSTKSSLPSTRLTGKPGPNWSICADGRGFAFFSYETEQSRRPNTGEVRVRPLYASFSAADRRMTKKGARQAHATVMGRQCVVTVEDIGEQCGGLARHDVCLVKEPILLDDSIPVIGPFKLPGGYLRESVLTDHSCLLKLPEDKEPYLFLLAYPLSCALAAQPLLESLEASGSRLTAAIWGAGTAGLLLVEMLRHRGWAVVISDLFAPQSQAAKVATSLGATYIQSDFNFEPEFKPLLSIDSSGDPASTEAALRCTSRHGHVLLWPEATVLTSGSLDDRLTILKSPNNHFLKDAIQIIQERFGGLMTNLITDIAPLHEFDRALFPRVPNRTTIVRIERIGKIKPLFTQSHPPAAPLPPAAHPPVPPSSSPAPPPRHGFSTARLAPDVPPGCPPAGARPALERPGLPAPRGPSPDRPTPSRGAVFYHFQERYAEAAPRYKRALAHRGEGARPRSSRHGHSSEELHCFVTSDQPPC
jgi:SAM-dependent methyltransferase